MNRTNKYKKKLIKDKLRVLFLFWMKIGKALKYNINHIRNNEEMYIIIINNILLKRFTLFNFESRMVFIWKNKSLNNS